MKLEHWIVIEHFDGTVTIPREVYEELLKRAGNAQKEESFYKSFYEHFIDAYNRLRQEEGNL